MERDKTAATDDKPFRQLYWAAVPASLHDGSITARSNRAWRSMCAAVGRAAREMDDLQHLLGDLGAPQDTPVEQEAKHAVHFMRRLMAETTAFEARLVHMAPPASSMVPAYGDDEVLPH
ncbi:hypothetical protein [Magnetococcus sp. PR-3]|uniref:hypothetical protein n=1 Tax=Magnetococcus sp. PR-3 TaxID=3120355 RepID=UPI002FCDEBC6